MHDFVLVVFTALLAFSSADYTLNRATVNDPVRVIVATIIAVVVVLVGVLSLVDVINL